MTSKTLNNNGIQSIKQNVYSIPSRYPLRGTPDPGQGIKQLIVHIGNNTLTLIKVTEEVNWKFALNGLKSFRGSMNVSRTRNNITGKYVHESKGSWSSGMSTILDRSCRLQAPSYSSKNCLHPLIKVKISVAIQRAQLHQSNPQLKVGQLRSHKSQTLPPVTAPHY